MKHPKISLLGALLLSSLFLNPLNSDPTLGNCEVFPTNNIWNTPVDTLPLHPFSESYVRSIGAQKKLKADFGSGLWEGMPVGIPFILRLVPILSQYLFNILMKVNLDRIQSRITHL